MRVGVLVTLPKTIASRLLEPMLDAGAFAIDLQHGPFDRLLEGLAAGRLHLVLADQTPPQGSELRLHAHPLGETELLVFGVPVRVAALVGKFPSSLHGASMLLPRSGSLLRRSIDRHDQDAAATTVDRFLRDATVEPATHSRPTPQPDCDKIGRPISSDRNDRGERARRTREHDAHVPVSRGQPTQARKLRRLERTNGFYRRDNNDVTLRPGLTGVDQARAAPPVETS